MAVLDGGQLQDGGIYLARPQPLALAGEVEYELQQNGKPVGLYDIKNAGQEQGSWVGLWGVETDAQRPAPAVCAKTWRISDIDDDAQSDTPVLHRKHHAGDAPAEDGKRRRFRRRLGKRSRRRFSRQAPAPRPGPAHAAQEDLQRQLGDAIPAVRANRVDRLQLQSR